MNATETTADRVREAREHARMTQVTLAQKAGLSQSYLSQIEAGSRTPGIHKLTAIAAALGVKVTKLIPDQP